MTNEIDPRRLKLSLINRRKYNCMRITTARRLNDLDTVRRLVEANRLISEEIDKLQEQVCPSTTS